MSAFGKEDEKRLDRNAVSGSVYDKIYFTDEELRRGQEILDQADEGKISRESAHNWWESTRAGYGYTGGEDGHGYTKLGQSSGKNAPTYVNQYKDIMDQAVGAVLGREKFAYDPATDPAYQQYADAYTRMGKRAMDDTLGKVAARTGGLASSYAATAAQQTYDGYMAQLADKVPELRQLAYQMYQDEGNEQRKNLQMLQNLEQIAYGRHMDGLNQYNADRNFERGVFESDRDYNYGVQRDQIADEQRQQEVDFERGLTAANLLAQSGNYSGYKDLFGLSDEDVAALGAGYINGKELQEAELLAQAGDFSGFQKIFNLSPEKVAKLEKAFQQQNAPKVTGSSSGGSRNNNSPVEYESLFERMMKANARTDAEARAYLMNGDSGTKYSFDDATLLVEDYMSLLADGGKYSCLGVIADIADMGGHRGADVYDLINYVGFFPDGWFTNEEMYLITDAIEDVTGIDNLAEWYAEEVRQ